MSFEGSGTGDFAGKVKVKGCGSYKADGDVTQFRMESGNWFLESPTSALSGTYKTEKAGKKFTLFLDEASSNSLVSFLEAASDELCGQAQGVNTVSGMEIRKFTVKLVKNQTKAKLRMKVRAIRDDELENGKLSYKYKAVTDFRAFGCEDYKSSGKWSWMTAVATPDLNADSASDIVFTQNSSRFKLKNIDLDDKTADSNTIVSSQVVVYLQDPFTDGVFRRQEDIPVHPETRNDGVYRGLASVAVGDLDGDSITDIAAPGYEANSIAVLLQDQGNPGAFTDLRTYPAPRSPEDVAIGELNGDGVNDMVVAGSYLALLNNDNQSPGAAFYEHALGIADTTSVAIADIDGDGRNDIATTTGGTVIVLLQDPEPASPGTFTAGNPYPAGTGAADVAVGDLNGDSLPDLAVANRGDAGGGSITIHYQYPAGTGTFMAGPRYQTDENTQRVKIIDLNNDDLPDLAVANNDHEGGSVSVLLQNDMIRGEFYEPGNYPGLYGPDDVAAVDVNGDGFADLVIADKCRDSSERPFIRHQDDDSPGSFLSPVYLP